MRKTLPAVVCLILALCASVQASEKIKIEEGTLGPCKIKVAVPEKWNKKVLILVHGLSLETSPLTADFDETGLPCAQMLRDGWIVASTSFRRNGFIIDEATRQTRRQQSILLWALDGRANRPSVCA